ncbi:gallidermin/nisin family lantibiotic [Pseudonocardia alni]|uniref:gallidermin/nisin family lantibiotic n=1 Tax=Pseudonocardia alni TaxID=33907 RepID=UPI00367A559B
MSEFDLDIRTVSVPTAGDPQITSKSLCTPGCISGPLHCSTGPCTGGCSFSR